MLEGMLVDYINRDSEDRKAQTSDSEPELSREMYAPKLTLDAFKGMSFTLEFHPEEEIQIGEDMYVTGIMFEKK